MSAAIRAAIVASLQAVPNIGHVHDRERYWANEQAFRAMYLYTPTEAQGGPQVRGWWVRRDAVREYSPNTGQRVVNVTTWRVRGFMAFNDALASELLFDQLMEAWRTQVRADMSLGGTCAPGPLDGDDSEDGVQLIDTGPVHFGGVLCHSANLKLTTWSYL